MPEGRPTSASLPTERNPEVRAQRDGNAISNHFENTVKETGQDHFPLWSRDPDNHTRGSRDNHILRTLRDRDLCIIFHHSPCSIIDTVAGNSIDRPSSGNWWLKTRQDDGKLRMLVVVGQEFKSVQEVDLLVQVSSRVVGLLPFEDFDGLRAHSTRNGFPLFPVLSSLRAIPFDRLLPNPLPKDWKVGATTRLRWIEQGHQMIKAGMDVVNEVARDDGDLAVDLGCEVKAVIITLAVSSIGQRVWVDIDITGDYGVEISEVFFGPLNLEEIGGDKITHAEW